MLDIVYVAKDLYIHIIGIIVPKHNSISYVTNVSIVIWNHKMATSRTNSVDDKTITTCPDFLEWLYMAFPSYTGHFWKCADI